MRSLPPISPLTNSRTSFDLSNRELLVASGKEGKTEVPCLLVEGSPRLKAGSLIIAVNTFFASTPEPSAFFLVISKAGKQN